ncbi:hypothetical protein BX285_6424 [Streptomyces sp. 1114.5]|uniref:hypothetical protein n=1 Tax=Streptomyces sp. 1114.5 TaxID=1938830 RepID=UPI000F236DEA|nr:hypothetical protein [Streptomyces sp. 1114.5]RKT09337.1 hypothetical protein BX285_6424 [Streptomyces sp. 1114.5]
MTTPHSTAALPLSDDFPVLLGPVRVETRFTADELLVRIFPDEWSVESFEPLPSQAEIGAVDAYWTALWRAGGNAPAEQSAWQELTARVPAGRASWLVQNRRPADPTDQPSGVDPGTTVLVVVTPQAVAAADRQPTVTYWTAVWQTHGDRAKLAAADAALLAAVGAARADAIRRSRPVGIDSAATVTGNNVLVAFLVLPPPAATDVSSRSWTQAPRARLLPDRFTVTGYVGTAQVFSVPGAPVPAALDVGPDPGSAEKPKVNEQTGELFVPAALRWLTDFEAAISVGMAVRVPLQDSFRGGVDRIVVLGLRQSSTADRTAADLADLLTRQLRSQAGLTLLPQGTPTNNSEETPAGQDQRAVSAAVLRSASAPTATAAADDWTTRTDGQWFADLLGIDPATMTGVAGADGTDQREARAANLALWPATWGSYLQTMLHPTVPDGTVSDTRDFFVRYVSGRGPVPAVRIGRQPYGILPTTAFSRLTWPDTSTRRRALGALLSAAAEDWRTAAGQVTYLGKPTPSGTAPADPHQQLLDILALHPTSAEYHQRYAQSVEDIYNRENFSSNGPKVLPALEDLLGMPQPIRALLHRLAPPGQPAVDPAIIRRLFTEEQYPLLGPLVDDQPLSESRKVRSYLPDGRNYLQWLADNAARDLESVRLEKGFTDDRPPAAVLYLLLRHAVLLGWEQTARALAAAAGETVSAADPLFIHIRTTQPPLPSESRYRKLYAPDPAITHDPSRLVVDFIPDVLSTHPAARQLAEQIAALRLLADLPTARLERVLAEHLDCATYRLDAWRLGLANERLAGLRYGADGTSPARRGLHLGAYGWLEDVRPGPGTHTPVHLTGSLGALFTPSGSQPLLKDPGNGGYIHAPSPAQATTAAVLRAGYLANGSRENPGSFAVNLSSDRVRTALTLLDGLRQGQSLGAMLGYRFERGLHEGHPGVELDKFLPALRGAFPLRSGKLSNAAPGTPVELVEARNVVDGLALVRKATREPAHPEYPFGVADLPTATDAEQKAMNAEVQHLLALHDALSDLAVAEATHQTLRGNPERASATLDAYAKEGFPPDPDVVRTPRSGVTLTHRLGLMFTPGLGPGFGAATNPGSGPRAQGEPAVNAWLPTLLPPPANVATTVEWQDPVTGAPRSRVVTQADLQLQPLDMLWGVPSDDATLTDLDDRIVAFVVAQEKPRPDTKLTIRHTLRIHDKLTFFETLPLVRALRSLLIRSRPLRPTDLVPGGSGQPVDRTMDDAVTVDRRRPAAVRTSLDRLRQDTAAYLASLAPLLPDPPAQPDRAALVTGIDTFLAGYADLARTAGGFGMARSGWGEAALWRGAVFGDVLTAVAATADRMAASLSAADALIAAYDRLPSSATADDRFRLLQQAEWRLTTKPTSPRPAQPAQLRTIVGSERSAFNTRLLALRAIARTADTTLSALLADVAALLPLSTFDPAGLDLTPFRDRVVAFARDLLDRARSLLTEVTGRLAAADKALAAYDQALTAADQVQAATDALQAMLGPDFLVVPEFTVPDQLQTDWKKARIDKDQLLSHLVHDFHRDFPVDDWVHGIARVREKPRLWEQAVLVADALRGPGGLLGDLPGWEEPELVPVQLPYRPNDHWLGMEFAAGTEIKEDRVLFTAHYAPEPMLGVNRHCGLLLDEWTEVVPARQETTGIAFHYNGPDAEPPQAMLLVVPPQQTGNWSADDLLHAVGETLDLAKIRAVEPAHLDTTPYAQLLPATVMSATRRPITISTDLATANLRGKADA